MTEEEKVLSLKEWVEDKPILNVVYWRLTTPRTWAQIAMKKYPDKENWFAGVSFALEFMYLGLIIVLIPKMRYFCPVLPEMNVTSSGINISGLSIPPGGF